MTILQKIAKLVNTTFEDPDAFDEIIMSRGCISVFVKQQLPESFDISFDKISFKGTEEIIKEFLQKDDQFVILCYPSQLIEDESGECKARIKIRKLSQDNLQSIDAILKQVEIALPEQSLVRCKNDK